MTMIRTASLLAATVIAATLPLAVRAQHGGHAQHEGHAHHAPAPAAKAPAHKHNAKAPAHKQGAKARPAVQTAHVTVTESGYQPAKLTLKKGVPARITFLRKTNSTCGTDVVFPDLKIKKTLPLNKATTVAFTPKKTGTYAFACGMNMVRGAIEVK